MTTSSKTNKQKKEIGEKIITFYRLNFVLFCVGMIGVWEVTHNFWALFWAFIASLHFTIKIKTK